MKIFYEYFLTFEHNLKIKHVKMKKKNSFFCFLFLLECVFLVETGIIYLKGAILLFFSKKKYLKIDI